MGLESGERSSGPSGAALIEPAPPRDPSEAAIWLRLYEDVISPDQSTIQIEGSRWVRDPGERSSGPSGAALIEPAPPRDPSDAAIWVCLYAPATCSLMWVLSRPT